jgi:CBS-domain-containing membrane protein
LARMTAGRHVSSMHSAHHRLLKPDAATIAIGTVGVVISALAVGLMAILSTLFIAPFASTAAIKYAAPDSHMAQPRSVLGGHLIGVLAGIGVSMVIGVEIVGPAVAAGVSMLVMIGTRTLHPPAVGVAIIACQHPEHPFRAIAAVGVAALVSIACAVVLYRVLHRQSYPSAGWTAGFMAPTIVVRDAQG